MTQDEIIEMASKVGLSSMYDASQATYSDWRGKVLAFAKLIENVVTEKSHARANSSWKLMCEKMVEAEREATLQTIEALYNSEAPNPMYQDGYNHALDHIEQFLKNRSKA